MRSESNADYHAFDGNVVPDQSVPESRFRDLAMIEIVAQGAALNPPRTTPDVISCDLFDCFIELEEESASPSANAGSKKEFSDVRITPESIEKADKESAEFLKNLGVRQLIVLKDGESRRVAVEFSRSQSIPINRDGCRDVVLSGSVGGRLTASADGKSAVISSIRGIEANIDLPDELRFLGGNSTTVDVKRVNFFEKDGVPMMEITGSKFDVEMSRTVPVPPEVMAIRQNVERLAENLGDQPQLNEADRRLVEDLTRDSGMPLYLKLAILAAGIGVLASKGHPLSIRDWLFGRGRQEASSQGDRKPSETREDTAGRSDGRGTERSASEKNAGKTDGPPLSEDGANLPRPNESTETAESGRPSVSPAGDSGAGRSDTSGNEQTSRPRIETITTVEQMRPGQRLLGFGSTPIDILAVSPEADLVVINASDGITLEAARPLAEDVTARIVRISVGDTVFFCDPVSEHVYQASADPSKFQQLRGAEVRLRRDILRETTNAVADDPTFRLVGEDATRFLQLANSGQEIRGGADLPKGLTEYIRRLGAALPPSNDSTLSNALKDRTTVVVDPTLSNGQSRLVYIGERTRKEIVLSRQERGAVRSTGTIVDQRSLTEGRFEIRIAADATQEHARADIAGHVSSLSGRVGSDADTGRDRYAGRNRSSEALEQAARNARGIDFTALTPEQRQARVIEILESTERELARQGWSAAERDGFRKVIDRYRQGRVSAEVIVHRHLDIRTNNPPPPGPADAPPPANGRPPGGAGGADARMNDTAGRASSPAALEPDASLVQAERNLILRASEEWNRRFLAKIPTTYDTRFEILLRSVVLEMRLEQNITQETARSLLAQIDRYGSKNPALSSEVSRRFSELTAPDLRLASERAAVQARANPFPGAPERVIIEGTTKISVHKDGIVVEAGRGKPPLTLTRDEIIKALDERISELERSHEGSARVDEKDRAYLDSLRKSSESYRKGSEIKSGVAKALASEALRRNNGRPPIGGTIVGAAVIVSTVMRYMNEDN